MVENEHAVVASLLLPRLPLHGIAHGCENERANEKKGGKVTIAVGRGGVHLVWCWSCFGSAWLCVFVFTLFRQSIE